MGRAGADHCFACGFALRPAIASPPRAAARIADAVPSQSTIARPEGCSSPRLVERCMGPWPCARQIAAPVTIALGRERSSGGRAADAPFRGIRTAPSTGSGRSLIPENTDGWRPAPTIASYAGLRSGPLLHPHREQQRGSPTRSRAGRRSHGREDAVVRVLWSDAWVRGRAQAL
jgi:hypothetical protein